MRRLFLFLLVAAGSLLISSCLTIEERVTLNADGSGTQVNTVDFSTLLENPMVKMGMAEEMKKNGNTDMTERIDSSFRVLDNMLELNPQWTAEQRELLGRVTVDMVMDIEEGVGVVKTKFNFNDPGEIAEMNELMATANQPEGAQEANPFASMSGQNFLASVITLKGKKMVRETTTSPGFENPMTEAGLDEATMGMMQEMFGDAVIGYVVEFPGNIKKVKGFPGHEIEAGNELRMVFDFMEVMNDPDVVAKALTGEVKFKK